MAQPGQFDGDDDRPMGSSHGQPAKFRCLDCPWHGKGYWARRGHLVDAPNHHIVWSGDPRPSPTAKQSAA